MHSATQQTDEKHILLIEPNATIAELLVNNLQAYAVVAVVKTAEQAIQAADDHTPDLVITELRLADHSAMGFLYEFRSYKEWQSVPIVVYTAQQLSSAIAQSRDWNLLDIAKYMYKPQTSMSELKDVVKGYLVMQ